MDNVFSITGKVELFPQKGGWYFIRVPKKYTEKFKDRSERGLIAISAATGDTYWDTSLLPMGDGTHFVALNAKVRKKEYIKLGDRVSLSFRLRKY